MDALEAGKGVEDDVGEGGGGGLVCSSLKMGRLERGVAWSVPGRSVDADNFRARMWSRMSSGIFMGFLLSFRHSG
jgi:hypothetical protein